jgi:hypothetical protein
MTDSAENRRRDVRVLGPFDGTRPGLFDLPLQIYDLSIGGCFINSVHDAPRQGQVFPIHIELPNGETVVAKGETAYVRPGFGYGVKFCQISDDHRARLHSALEEMLQAEAERHS